MTAEMLDIKRKIKSVTGAEKVTRAMKLVAGTRLKKAKASLEGASAFYEKTHSTALRLGGLPADKGGGCVLIAIASDRGFCGGFSHAVLKECKSFMSEKRVSSLIICGDKLLLERKLAATGSIKSVTHFGGITEKPDYNTACDIARIALDTLNVGEAYVIYTRKLRQTPVVERILPLACDNAEGFAEFEPSQKEIIDFFVKRYLTSHVYFALAASSVCQQAARLEAMGSASENADKLLEKYTARYNMLRQSMITNEIAEITANYG